LWGDIQAMVSSFHVARTRLIELFGKYGLTRSKLLIEECLSYGEAKARAVIARIPDGAYDFVDFLDDDINSPHPVRICLSLQKSGTGIHLDFSGTDPQVMAAINLATAGKKSHTWLTSGLIQFMLTADRDMPVNGGILRPISVNAPAGTIVHAVPPAALSGRLVTGIRVMDAIFGALVQALPNEVPTAGSGQGLLSVLSTPGLADGVRKVHVLQPLVGGTGARPTSDGYDGTNYSLSFMKNTPIEIIETEMDVLIHRYYFVADSGGAGEFRGGLGVGMRAEAIGPDTTVALRLTQPVMINPGRANERRLPKSHDVLRLSSGDVFEFATSGGGGYGDPLMRKPERVAEEVRYGFVSRTQAENLYGVVLGESGLIDVENTKRKRTQIAELRGDRLPTFNFCRSRKEYDRIWNDEAYRELNAILSKLSIHARVYAKVAIMDEILSSGKGQSPLDPAAVRAAWAKTHSGLEMMRASSLGSTRPRSNA
jgi:N-methylhydantoinase B